MLKNVREFLSGASKFYSQFKRREAESTCLWQEGNTQILKISEENKDLPTLVFIPSLINKSYILDLSDEVSVIRYFTSLGYEVLLVNFLEIDDAESDVGLADFIARVSRGVNFVVEDKKFITIGYCLGGVFSLALSSHNYKNLLGQVIIATPWDFTNLKKNFMLENELVFENLKFTFGSCKKISPTLIQWSLSLLAPDKIWQKFCKFSKMTDIDQVQKFTSIEQWVNDGLSLPNKFFFECLSILRSNDISNEKYFKLNKEIPTLSFYGTDDKIVPPSSCLPLYNLIYNNNIIAIDTGHVGLIVSNNSYNKLCASIKEWLSNLK